MEQVGSVKQAQKLSITKITRWGHPENTDLSLFGAETSEGHERSPAGVYIYVFDHPEEKATVKYVYNIFTYAYIYLPAAPAAPLAPLAPAAKLKK